MSYLLDTNIISETVKRKPDEQVLEWLTNVPNDAICISVLTLGEIRKGIEKATDKIHKEKLVMWLEYEIPAWFGKHILGVDEHVTDRWGRMEQLVGRNVPVIDGLLAATALQHDLRLVTRNLVDFQIPGLEIINPFPH